MSASVLYYYRDELLWIWSSPFCNIANLEPSCSGISVNEQSPLIYTNITEPFITTLILVGVSAILLNIPIIYYNIAVFLKPGLYYNEYIVLRLLLTLSFILLFLSLISLYFVIIPTAFKFLMSYSKHDYTPTSLLPQVYTYITSISKFVFLLLISLQLPIITSLISADAKVNLNSDAKANSNATQKSKSRVNQPKSRKLLYFLFLIAATIITPPDVTSQIFVTFGFIAIYEFTNILKAYLFRLNSLVHWL